MIDSFLYWLIRVFVDMMDPFGWLDHIHPFED